MYRYIFNDRTEHILKRPEHEFAISVMNSKSSPMVVLRDGDLIFSISSVMRIEKVAEYMALKDPNEDLNDRIRLAMKDCLVCKGKGWYAVGRNASRTCNCIKDLTKLRKK